MATCTTTTGMVTCTTTTGMATCTTTTGMATCTTTTGMMTAVWKCASGNFVNLRHNLTAPRHAGENTATMIVVITAIKSGTQPTWLMASGIGTSQNALKILI